MIMPLGDYFQKYGPMQRRRGKQPEQQTTPPPQPPQPPHKPRRRTQSTSPHRRHAYSTFRRRWSALTVPHRMVLRGGVVLFVLLCVPYVIALLFGNHALPGVFVEGLPVGGLDHHAIRTVVTTRHMRFIDEPLTLRESQRVWHPTLRELGGTLDADGVANDAILVGKHGSPFTRYAELWHVWRHGVYLVPHIVLDGTALQTYLLHIAQDVEYSPRDWHLSVAGGTPSITPGRDGKQMLVDETAHDIALALQHLTPHDMVVRTRKLVPTIDETDAITAHLDAQRIVSNTLILTHETTVQTWAAEDIAPLIAITEQQGHLHVALDDERVATAVSHVAQTIDSRSVEPRVHFDNGTLHIVEDGTTGWQLQQTETITRIKHALNNNTPHIITHTIALPVATLTPHITADTLADVGIVEQVSVGKSSFVGSEPYRITNIIAGAKQCDGVLIAPDDTFSFNTQVGDITPERGFVEGYAVIGNRTQLEWGGGICQVSTTVFRAAFWAGVPIVERHAHPFYIRWYDAFAYGEQGDGPGMDATIYTGMSDLRFVNDTGHWLLMQTTVDQQAAILTVQLYGTAPARRVALDGPYISNEVAAPTNDLYIDDPSLPAGTLTQSDVARNGRDVVLYRVLYDGEQEIHSEAFITRFRPWPNVYVRGTASADTSRE